MGGSITGAATALYLAEAGLKVEIFEAKKFPREKVCGEGFMPHGVRMLKELGVLARIRPEDRSWYKGIEYVIDGKVRARGEFPEIGGGFRLGLGVRRSRLDLALLDLARAHPNVTVHENVRVDAVLRDGNGWAVGLRTRAGHVYGRLIIGADGRGSIVRRELGLDKSGPKRQRWGLRTHFAFRNEKRVGDFVEIYKNRHGELYTTPVSRNELLVALLLEKQDMEAFRGGLESAFHAYLRRYPYLSARLEGGEQCSDVMACGPVGCASSRPYSDGAMLVGDAAGFLDPITGEGLSIALACAKAASAVAVAALACGPASAEALAPYGSARAHIARQYMIFTTLMLGLSRHMQLAKWIVRRLGCSPGLFRTFLGIHCGQLHFRDVNPWDVGRFFFAIPPRISGNGHRRVEARVDRSRRFDAPVEDFFREPPLVDRPAPRRAEEAPDG